MEDRSQSSAVQEAIAGRTIYRQDTIRMFGLPESGLAETLREAEHDVPAFDSLEITTCLRRGEIEMVTRYEPDAADTYRQLTELLRDRHGQHMFSEDGAQVDDQVAQLLTGRRIATAESCTGGLLAARLTDRPGSSAYLAGGVVAYANDAKTELLGVDPALIDAHGAVSEPVAEAMAAGALRRFDADTAVAITGIAGPGGGTEEKPVGTVCFTVAVNHGVLDPHASTARQPLRHPGALNHGGDAPAASSAHRSRSVRLPLIHVLRTARRFARVERRRYTFWLMFCDSQLSVISGVVASHCRGVVLISKICSIARHRCRPR